MQSSPTVGTGRHAQALVWAMLLLVLGLSTGWLPVEHARADEASTTARETPEYTKAISTAVREFEAGNYAEARAMFSKAHELFPNARTLRGLGIVEFELKNYGDCIERLEAALASQVKPLTGEKRASAADLLERAKQYVARLELDIDPVEDARVVVDGIPVKLIRGNALVLTVGEHVLEIQAPGYLAERRAVSVKGGEENVMRVELSVKPDEAQPVAQSVPAAVLQPDRRDQGEGRAWFKNPWLWAGVGVAVVGGGVAAAFLLKPDDEKRAGDPTTTANTPPGSGFQALGRF